jgi:hypothetical protein
VTRSAGWAKGTGRSRRSGSCGCRSAPDGGFLFQGAAHADVPFTSAAETHLELGTALSATLPVGLSPLFELIVEVPLEGDEAASWAVGPGFRWELGHDWEVGASGRAAVAGPREADLRLMLGFIRHFPLPGGGG